MPGVRKKVGRVPLGKRRPLLPAPIFLSLAGEKAPPGDPQKRSKSPSRSEQACFSSAGCCVDCPRTPELLPPMCGSYGCPAPHTLLCVGPATRVPPAVPGTRPGSESSRSPQPPTLLTTPSAPHYLHSSSMEPVLLLAGNAVSAFLQTRPPAYILFAYVLIRTSICFVPSQPLNPPPSVHRQHSSQCRPPMLPSIMAWPWLC